MILAHGILLDNSEQDRVIGALCEDIHKTLLSAPISTEEVIAACDRLSQKVLSGAYDDTVRPLLDYLQITEEAFRAYCLMFSSGELQKKVENELSGLPKEGVRISDGIRRVRQPLGVLLHIAAGNIDVLPAYSVVEGLLAGNINILKLPTGDSGVSVKLLSELIREYPPLQDYIYVFDVPSTETETIRRLSHMADGVVVWGGDGAIRAAHQMIEPNTRLIPWGHKLSFAYADPHTDDAMLYDLAVDICRTNQMLCTSCQGIYVDTDSMAVLEAFGQRFFTILKEANRRLGPASMGMRGKNTLRLYTDRLERAHTVLSDEGVSVVIREDEELTLSYLYRNVWIKALPKERIIPVLKPQKGYLQSCALLLSPGNHRSTVLAYLQKAGLTRITDGSPSTVRPGEAHDGRFPLLEYSRVVDICEGP